MLLSLAAQLRVLPDELNRLLIIVVVLSMALTPTLADLGLRVAARSAQGQGDGAPWPAALPGSCAAEAACWSASHLCGPSRVCRADAAQSRCPCAARLPL